MASAARIAKKLSLQLSQWPAAERAAWELATGQRSSLFGPAGRASELRSATMNSYANVVGQWLAHLQHHGWLVDHEGPADRFRIDRLNAWMADMDHRGLKSSSIRQTLTSLKAAMKYIVPGADLSWLTRPQGRSLSQALPSPRRELTAPDREIALRFVQGMHRQALVMPDGPARRRVLRDAALVGLFVALGPRRASVVRMRFDRLHRQSDGTWIIKFCAEDMKNGRRHELPLDHALTQMVDDYLRQARNGFYGAAETDHIWMGGKGPLTHEGVSRTYENFTRACFGKAMGPHSARRMFRAAASRISPTLALDAALTLDHSLEIAVHNYTEACTLHVSLRHADRLQRLRDGGGRPSRVEVAHPLIIHTGLPGGRSRGSQRRRSDR